MMKKYKIPRRKPAETLKIQFDRSPLSFNKKIILMDPENKLYQAGLMLYWAEGAKADHGVVDFANSNPEMIKLFLSMLRKIYQIRGTKLRCLLYCYGNQAVDELIDFWSSQLTIPKSQFTRPYVRTDFKISQSGKMPLGLIHVRYNDKRLLRKILDDIDIIVSGLSRGSRVDKYAGL